MVLSLEYWEHKKEALVLTVQVCCLAPGAGEGLSDCVLLGVAAARQISGAIRSSREEKTP